MGFPNGECKNWLNGQINILNEKSGYFSLFDLKIGR